MATIEIDGKSLEVEDGSMIIEAADAAGIYIPRFCYHEKLSIAANCRMCLVEVEKAPKPLPACATPVADGMKISTASEVAIEAQNGTMEFLLINHPLDCPVCDQGGECPLQDQALGYGKGESRYQESKRVVENKDIGPLVSTEMTRCIHCTRCVRFGQEIAGVMELGTVGRGENMEIDVVLGDSVDTELSGNMIDLCPVGALTSRPYHDSLGSNLEVQSIRNEVKRVLPVENRDVNECWISDRDRFSYEGINAADRLTQPRTGSPAALHASDWQAALQFAADGIRKTINEHGADAVAAVIAPSATTEEHYLLQRLCRTLGSGNVDHRLRQIDFRASENLKLTQQRVPGIGRSVSSLSNLDNCLLVGCNIRKEQPLMSARLREAVKSGAKISDINPLAFDFNFKLAARLVATPAAMVVSVSGASVGEIPDANSAGASIAGAVYHRDIVADETAAHGDALPSLLTEDASHRPRCWILFGVEPELDCANSRSIRAALNDADFVVHFTSFEPDESAHVALPIATYAENEGSYVNCEGLSQEFDAAVVCPGETRPGWKIIRVLGNLLAIPGFDYVTVADVRKELDYSLSGPDANRKVEFTSVESSMAIKRLGERDDSTFERILDVPMYRIDATVRRGVALQQTLDNPLPAAHVNQNDMNRLGIQDQEQVRIAADNGTYVELKAVADARIPEHSVYIPLGWPETAVEVTIGK